MTKCPQCKQPWPADMDDCCPRAVVFAWTSSGAVFEDLNGEPLCSVSNQMMHNIASWAMDRGLGKSY